MTRGSGWRPSLHQDPQESQAACPRWAQQSCFLLRAAEQALLAPQAGPAAWVWLRAAAEPAAAGWARPAGAAEVGATAVAALQAASVLKVHPGEVLAHLLLQLQQAAAEGWPAAGAAAAAGQQMTATHTGVAAVAEAVAVEVNLYRQKLCLKLAGYLGEVRPREIKLVAGRDVDRPPAQGKGKGCQISKMHAIHGGMRGGVLLHGARMQSSQAYATADPAQQCPQAAWDDQRHGDCTMHAAIKDARTSHMLRTVPKQDKQEQHDVVALPKSHTGPATQYRTQVLTKGLSTIHGAH